MLKPVGASASLSTAGSFAVVCPPTLLGSFEVTSRSFTSRVPRSSCSVVRNTTSREEANASTSFSLNCHPLVPKYTVCGRERADVPPRERGLRRKSWKSSRGRAGNWSVLLLGRTGPSPAATAASDKENLKQLLPGAVACSSQPIVTLRKHFAVLAPE